MQKTRQFPTRALHHVRDVPAGPPSSSGPSKPVHSCAETTSVSDTGSAPEGTSGEVPGWSRARVLPGTAKVPQRQGSATGARAERPRALGRSSWTSKPRLPERFAQRQRPASVPRANVREASPTDEQRLAAEAPSKHGAFLCRNDVGFRQGFCTYFALEVRVREEGKSGSTGAPRVNPIAEATSRPSSYVRSSVRSCRLHGTVSFM